MNVTELVYLTSDIVRYHIFRETPIYHYLSTALSFTAIVICRLATKALALGWILFKDVIQIGLVLGCLALLYILFSFYQCLEPRYKFIGEKSQSTVDEQGVNDQVKPKTQYYCIICEDKQKQQSWIKRFINRLKSERSKVEEESRGALSIDDIQTVYKRLSWSQTQIDFESINWLNQTVQTFWPSIKTLLDKLVFKDLLRPKSQISSNSTLSNKKLASRQAKLSILISSMRRLEFLRNRTIFSKYKSYIDKSAIAILIFFVKMFLIYLKQFIIDYARYLVSASSNKEKEKRYNVNLERFLKSSHEKNEEKGARSGRPKTWTGFDLNSGRRRNDNQTLRNKRKMKFKSAEALKNRRVFLEIGPKSISRLRKKRLHLVTKSDRAIDPLEERKPVIERIALGHNIPTITGIKYIEETNNRFLSAVDKVTRPLAPSDNSNMRYIIELTYRTDSHFKIQVKSLPILNHIKLTRFCFRIRLLITINHTTCELNKSLRILETPADILWPVVNYVHVALVDVPHVDWQVEEPAARMTSKTRLGEKDSKSRLLKVMEKYSNYLNPIKLINHIYFKYLVHSALYLGLKWFQPFDIKIGKHLYLKSIC